MKCYFRRDIRYLTLKVLKVRFTVFELLLFKDRLLVENNSLLELDAPLQKRLFLVKIRIFNSFSPPK